MESSEPLNNFSDVSLQHFDISETISNISVRVKDCDMEADSHSSVSKFDSLESNKLGYHGEIKEHDMNCDGILAVIEPSQRCEYVQACKELKVNRQMTVSVERCENTHQNIVIDNPVLDNFIVIEKLSGKLAFEGERDFNDTCTIEVNEKLSVCGENECESDVHDYVNKQVAYVTEVELNNIEVNIENNKNLESMTCSKGDEGDDCYDDEYEEDDEEQEEICSYDSDDDLTYENDSDCLHTINMDSYGDCSYKGLERTLDNAPECVSVSDSVSKAQIEAQSNVIPTKNSDLMLGKDEGTLTSNFSVVNQSEINYYYVDTTGIRISDANNVKVNESFLKLDLTDSEQMILFTYCQETEIRLTMRKSLRQINYAAVKQRPEESYFTKLDSSLKKNRAFVRKLKTFTGSQVEQLIKDMSSLNLTKYVSEVAAAIVEAKLKMSDVWPAIQLCNIMHQLYTDFSPSLLENWQKVLSLKKDDKIANQAKLRVDLRFYAELISAGIFTHKEGLPLLGNVLTMLTHLDREEHLNINIILSFCRHCGEDYAGLISRSMRILADKFGVVLPSSVLLTKEKQKNVKVLLKDYYNSLCKHLLKDHQELQSFIRQNKKILQTKGELSAERKEKLEALQNSYDRIENGTKQFAEVLDEDFPTLPEDESLKCSSLIASSLEIEESALATSLWEDEETRRFYEVLPDMKEFMPSLQVHPAEPEAPISEEALDAEFEKDFGGDGSADEEILPPEAEEIDEPEPVLNPSNKIMLETFLNSLPNCVNREMIDSAAVDFVMTLNSKHNRKKLVRTLFNVPRIRLDLLPFYARLVATLHPVIPDVATELAQMLKQEFRYHVRKKDQMNIESKIKVVRFIGELVKFRMFSKIDGLYCLKLLIHDFDHHHIEMCCNLLESCGRFFFRHPDCYQRMKVYLDQMLRKKSVIALDSRHVTMIENAYYYVNPPDATQTTKKQRPPEQEFVRKILFQDLMKSNTDKVLRQMRKLDWNLPDISAYAIKCLTHAYKVKYFNIRCLASLLAGLAAQQECVGTQVVDGVLEDIRLGMEVNLPKCNQRRVAMIKYLGELYNYRMVESSNIFQVLYSLITFGVTWDYNIPCPLDPPDHLFRIRLVCVLLETCGQYFVSGISKKKLDAYLTYFQHYYWFKYSDPYWTIENSFPVSVSHMFRETITMLRRKIHLFESLEEAQAAVNALRAELELSIESTSNQPQETNTDKSLYQNVSMENNNIDICEIEPSLDEEFSADNVTTSIELQEKSLSSVSPMQDASDEYAAAFHNISEDTEEDNSYDHISDDTDVEWGASGDPSSCNPADQDSQDTEISETKCGGPSLIPCPEDEEFLNAFEKMVVDNIQDRMRETVKPQQVDISVPLHIKSSSKKTYEQLQEEEESMKTSVNFVLMLRKGHKQQYKNLAVPVNSEMAMNLKYREEAERAEKERVKRLTLDINERLEEEDYQDMLAQNQRPVCMNLNRERKHKYQHPKGAPDVDLIFGSKKGR